MTGALPLDPAKSSALAVARGVGQYSVQSDRP
jgi:hypothetical protein